MLDGLALAPNGDLYVADASASTVRRIDATTTTITSLTQKFGGGESGDGGPAAMATLDRPHGIAIGTAGVYVAAGDETTVRLIAGGTITAVAGLFDPSGTGARARARLSRIHSRSAWRLRISALTGSRCSPAGAPGVVEELDAAHLAAVAGRYPAIAARPARSRGVPRRQVRRRDRPRVRSREGRTIYLSEVESDDAVASPLQRNLAV